MEGRLRQYRDRVELYQSREAIFLLPPTDHPVRGTGQGITARRAGLHSPAVGHPPYSWPSPPVTHPAWRSTSDTDIGAAEGCDSASGCLLTKQQTHPCFVPSLGFRVLKMSGPPPTSGRCRLPLCHPPWVNMTSVPCQCSPACRPPCNL